MKTKEKNRIVAVVGLWHLGLINTVGFAEKNYKVYGLDFDNRLINSLKRKQLPLYEPGLDKKIAAYLKNKKIIFSSNPRLVSKADYVVIAYDSPVDDEDRVDISPVVSAAKKISIYLKEYTPVIITSQIPLATSEKIEVAIRKSNPTWRSGVVYTPENLKLGSAIKRFLKPDMIVLGANNKLASESAKKLYSPFKTQKIYMDLRSAEMVKHALNTYLAASITFGNEIAGLSEKLGADAVKVITALVADTRVGRSPIFPGLGFSGGTLARDVNQLLKFAKKNKYTAPLLRSIIYINEKTFKSVTDKLRSHLGLLEGRKVGLLGLTYKPETSTLRRSPALKIIHSLVKLKVICFAFDPKADSREFRKISRLVKRVDTVIDLAKKSDVLVLVTEWSEFKKVDYKKVAKYMKKPLIIDTKNFLDPEEISKSGFEYVGYGR